MRFLSLLLLAAWPLATPAAIIVVDTGHSPKVAGATAADGRGEFQFNRAFSRALIKSLKDKGHMVVDVHGAGLDGSLASRAAAAKGADVFISIHHDSVQPAILKSPKLSEYRGFAVLLSGKTQNPAGSVRCAVEVGDAMVAAGESPSLYHADPIPGENRPLLDRARGIHRYDNLAVLKGAPAPALLLEVGVIVNPVELPKLSRLAWVEKTAAHVADGLDACVPR